MDTRQLWLDLTPKGGPYRAETFVNGQSNALARKALADWRNWPGGILALSGPAGCGKSHLAHLWARSSGARPASLAQLPRALDGVLLVQDLPDHMDELALFRIINAAADGAVRVLLSGRQPPRLWPVRMPDLHSRLAAMHHVQILEPDAVVLTGVLKKLFSDRQIVPDAPVIPYLLTRMERSTAAALDIVERIHALGHDQRRNVRLPLVRAVLAQIKTETRPAPDLFDCAPARGGTPEKRPGHGCR